MKVLEDRQCQIDARDEAIGVLKRGKNPIIRASVGFGKTEVGFMVKREMQSKKTLWLVPGDVLLGQTAERAEDNGFGASSKWPARTPWSPMNDIMVVTPQTAWNRYQSGLMQNGDKPDLLVVDEAHHCYTSRDPRHTEPQVAKLVKALNIPTLGLTATPWRLSDRQGFDELFDHLVETPPMRELVRLGYLAPTRLVVPQSTSDRVTGAGMRNGEYTAKGIEANNDQQIYTKRAIAMLKQEQGDRDPVRWKQTILYAVSLGHAVKLANLLAAEGVPTGFISSRAVADDEDKLDSNVQADRDLAVQQFKAGGLRAVVNYAIVTEGFDLAGAEIVVITRPTLSLALYRQMNRATRMMPGKTEGVIIDCTDNWSRFGGPMSQDVFQLEPREDDFEPGEKEFIILCNRPPARDDQGNMSVCGTIIPNARVQRCPSCDHPQGRKCERCGTFRRTEHYVDPDAPGVCAQCIDDENARVEAAKLKTVEAVADRLYQTMRQTQKARDGKDGKGSRWTKRLITRDGKPAEEGDKGAVELQYGIREESSSRVRGGDDASWKPWARVGEVFIGGRASFETKEEAMVSLVKRLENANVMPDVGQHDAPEPEPQRSPRSTRLRRRSERIARPSRDVRIPSLRERLERKAERQQARRTRSVRW